MKNLRIDLTFHVCILQHRRKVKSWDVELLILAHSIILNDVDTEKMPKIKANLEKLVFRYVRELHHDV
jgi:hypothetical protein